MQKGEFYSFFVLCWGLTKGIFFTSSETEVRLSLIILDISSAMTLTRHFLSLILVFPILQQQKTRQITIYSPTKMPFDNFFHLIISDILSAMTLTLHERMRKTRKKKTNGLRLKKWANLTHTVTIRGWQLKKFFSVAPQVKTFIEHLLNAFR